MKTILVSAYAVQPYKGSEDGMGWNFILQIARYNKVIAITRKNNGPHIERYMNEHPEMQEHFSRITFMYFDLPKWMLFWKKGPMLSMIYFYIWQLTLALWLRSKKLDFDVAHNLNFHNDWTPSFLWMLGKPFIWGPVGHHPRVPEEFMKAHYSFGARLKDKALWAMKNLFWHLDPFLRITRAKAKTIICMNEETRLMMKSEKAIVIPSVASEFVEPTNKFKEKFVVLSAGRFVALKGFDLTIRAFGDFYRHLNTFDKQHVRLHLLGSGPEKENLLTIIKEEGLEAVVTITEWIAREKMPDMYNNSSVFLFPSHEGAGMVVAEAMSYGIPVVCLENCGPGEFVHPDSELRVKIGAYDQTVAGLASKIKALHRDRYFYRHERMLALDRFATYLSWNKRGPQLNYIYEAAMNSRKRIVQTNTKLSWKAA